MSASTEKDISPRAATLDLLAYCQREDWAGYDPYDALNTKLFGWFPFLDAKPVRIGLIQALKRLPINLRPLLGVAPAHNPKALALFLSASIKLQRLGLVSNGQLSKTLLNKILALRSPGENDWCWGYSFPWQTRTVLVPRGAPNLVCTVFVANALLDLYEETSESALLEIAASAGNYLRKLYYTESDGVASFCYPLSTNRAKVHNANFLAAGCFSRLFQQTRDSQFLEPALSAARYSASRQDPDGSWYYGELPTQRWIDNFHTGFNLSALRTIASCLETDEFNRQIDRGFEFYRRHFIREDGAVRYYHDRTYPIDIHCVAQTILTLLEFQGTDPSNHDQIQSVYRWAVENMRDRSGFFYYRVLRTIPIRIPYMRWSQAWMLLALTSLVEKESPVEHQLTKPGPQPALT